MVSAIEFRSVSKRYDKQGTIIKALNALSFAVLEGEAFGFIGANGAGKSTAIKIMLDIVRCDSGEVLLFGLSAGESNSRKGVAYVPEGPAFYDRLTPLEILRHGLHMYGASCDTPSKWCMQWLDKFSIAHNSNRPIRDLSKGTVQRVALAHALAASPRLLILDEPLSGLDPIGRRDVVNILAEYRASGGTIFLTSHVLHDVERLADRFGLIHQGQLRAIRSPAELIGEDERVLLRTQGVGAAVEGMVAEPGGRWSIELPRHDLWSVLRAVESARHIVVEIKPVLSLEAAFLKVVAGEVHSLEE